MERSYIRDVAEEKSHQPEIESAIPNQQYISNRAERQPDNEPGGNGVSALPGDGAQDDEAERCGCLGKHFRLAVPDPGSPEQARHGADDHRDQNDFDHGEDGSSAGGE